ncbi:MAG TPA: penicillin-binding protein 2, partial [Azospirillaceae bacterium]|nr:penicillin-binding protein 2 [Azospirillaceae bacterium]
MTDAVYSAFEPAAAHFGFAAHKSARARTPADKSLERARARLLVTAACFTMAFGVVALRLVDATVLSNGVEPPAIRAAGKENAATGRADIVDRNGV